MASPGRPLAPEQDKETPKDLLSSPEKIAPWGFLGPAPCVAARFAFGFTFEQLNHLKKRNAARTR